MIETTLVVVVTVVLWATARLPEYLTALLFFAAATILAVAPPGVVFSGFASAAFWLILSGFVLGAAIRANSQTMEELLLHQRAALRIKTAEEVFEGCPIVPK